MTLWFHSLTQQVDQNGAPDRWSIAFVKAGTSIKAAAYKDPQFLAPHPAEIFADSFGRMPAIYLKPDGERLDARITYGSTGRVKEITGIDPGTPTPDAASSATPKTPVITKSGTVITLTKDDAGRVIVIPTATGQNSTVFLPRSGDVADGLTFTLKNEGGGVVVIRAAGYTLIDNIASILLATDQEAAVIASSGAGYETIARTPRPPRRVNVRSRTLTTPPTVTNPGDTYIAAASGNGWTINSLMTANGAGGWIHRRPDIGDTAIIDAESVTTPAGVSKIEVTWSGTEWVESSRRFLQIMSIQDSYASSTGSLAAHGGVQPTANFWTRNKLSTLVDSTIPGAVLASDVVTLPKGVYRITARRRVKGAISGKLAFRSLTTSSKAVKGMPLYLAANEQGEIACDGRIDVTATQESFELVFILAGTVAATTLGDASAIAGETEVYAEVTIQTLSAT